MNRERWQKFIFLSSMAGVNCMMREPIGKVLADPDTRAFYKKLMQECLAVGQKSGAKVPDSWIDDRMTFSDNAPPGMKASMLHDLEAGNRLELDWLTGKIVVARQGARRADAGQRRGLCRGQAAPDGAAELAATRGLAGQTPRRRKAGWRIASRSLPALPRKQLISAGAASRLPCTA